MCMGAELLSVLTFAQTAVSTLTGINSSNAAAKQAQREAEYANQLNRRNAELAEINAKDVKDQGIIDQEAKRREYKAKVGQLATQYGAGNVSLDSGSALDMLADTADLGELEAQSIGAKADRQSKDYLRQADDYRNQGLLAVQKAENAKPSGLEMGSSILTGVSSVAGAASNLSNSFKTQTASPTSMSTPSAYSNAFEGLESKKKKGAYYF